MLLTYVSIFYLPLAFCAVSSLASPCHHSIQNFSAYQEDAELYEKALWAIPNITDSGTRGPFVITSAIVGLITLLVVFNLENIAGSMGKVYQCWRDKVLGHMRSKKEILPL